MALSPPAGQGGTGDPRLPCRTRPSLRRHPLAGGGMSPHAAPSRFALSPSPSTKTALLVDERATLPSPSTKTALLVDEWPFRLRHPRKRPFWWTNGPFASGGPGRYRRPGPVPAFRAQLFLDQFYGQGGDVAVGNGKVADGFSHPELGRGVGPAEGGE